MLVGSLLGCAITRELPRRNIAPDELFDRISLLDVTRGGMKMVNRRLAVYAVAMSIFGFPGMADANMLVNGSFEDGPSLGSAAFIMLSPGSGAIVGWTVGGNGIDYAGPGTWNISEGSRNVDLDGSTGFSDSGSISQTFATDIGQKYSVSFDLSGNPAYYPILKELRVSAGADWQDFSYDIGDLNLGALPLSISYTPETFLFTATESSSTLTFTSLTYLHGITSYGAIIDNVVADKFSSPVPEPATVLLLSTGIVILIGFRGRRPSSPIVAINSMTGRD